MSVVDICNSALNHIGGNNITSLTEDSKPARLLNQRYEPVRDAVFRSHPWNCLVTRTDMADSTAPAFDFSYQYTLPSDCLRVLQAQYLDTVFKVEGRKILTDETTFNLIYIKRETDTAQYDSLLIDALAARLASEIAYPLIASSVVANTMLQVYDQKVREARFVDATEGMPGSMDQVSDTGGIEANTFIASRY